MPDLAIEIFSNDIEYDFAHFDCGEESLNIFLTNHLARQHNSRILRGYLLVTKEPKPKIVGYYTLSGSCFPQTHRNGKYLTLMCPASPWGDWLSKKSCRDKTGEQRW